MAQVVTGLRAILSFAAIYNFLQWVVGSSSGRREFVRCHVRAEPGQTVLDIGCGTADLLAYLPQVAYYGFDSSAQYIKGIENVLADGRSY